jgi:hypothetical protein
MFAEAMRAAVDAHTAYWRRVTRHPMDGCPQCAILTAVRTGGLNPMIAHNGYVCFQLAFEAVHCVAERFGYLLNDVRRGDACAPLIELFRLGVWPIGASRGSFHVFVPEPVH